MAKVSQNIELIGLQTDGNFHVELNGTDYHLNESRFKAIKRKLNMPISRLEIWLKSYADENV